MFIGGMGCRNSPLSAMNKKNFPVSVSVPIPGPFQKKPRIVQTASIHPIDQLRAVSPSITLGTVSPSNGLSNSTETRRHEGENNSRWQIGQNGQPDC